MYTYIYIYRCRYRSRYMCIYKTDKEVEVEAQRGDVQQLQRMLTYAGVCWCMLTYADVC